ncbi:Ricin-type beta-trefoil lectin domain-like [Actinoalloteichus cyanogriseus DSM 43889]|uniref:Ricin-type beta-trefoil lectin domain-like n=1 Tax=Actinoalloteichus caeruleus DSM 43889 TaxID=1120930 RepID=A0ABT1JRB4_ACTCY|nr:Ricin-type beta-trefoil lectin domain-like [Actinoalloteichus caeruleus DSM 43889]
MSNSGRISGARPTRRWRTAVTAVIATVFATLGVPAAANAATVDPNAYYQLVNRHSGKALDIEARGTGDGVNAVQWTRNSGTNQQFRFLPSGDGWYRIQARHSGKVLDLYEFDVADGARVVQWADLNGHNQQFRAADSAGGHVRLINRLSGKALEVWEWSTEDGARVSQYSDHDGHNQQWQLVPVDGGGTQPPGQARQVEDLNRGLISARSGNGNLVSWRLLGTDPAGVAFNLYRGSTRVNSSPITDSTNYFDGGASATASYTVRAVVNGTEQGASEPSLRFGGGNYLDVPLQVPSGGRTPDGVDYTYSANDASVGDLDGDGQYEFVVKWDPSNSKDNAHSGHTGNVFVDAYRLDGTRLWRIDLGRNIRAGAHYTQFQVYDFDGDGRAEVAMKTADGTVDGAGRVIGNANADHRNSSGYVLAGPEFLTVFDGRTGAALSTVDYLPARGNVSDWGDNYGNRVDRFLAGTAYLDGQRPSLIMSRGYYTRTVIVAWDFRDGSLTRRWTFDSNSAGSQYRGQGFHSLSIADVDGDGRDEIVFGAMVIDDDGTPLWNTGYGHGDALHVGDFVPSRPGLEVFGVAENSNQPSSWLVDARTGQPIYTTPANGDNGRGVAGDIWAGSPGAEMWSSRVDGMRDTQGRNVGRKPSSTNFLIWWDGDPVRELLDQTRIDKYGPNGDTRLLTANGVASNNGTKATPALSGDLFGDWREEVVWRTSDSRALRIYTTTDLTDLRIPTLMHDTQYRVAIAWQNTAYNQPPHPSFFIGDGMAPVPQPNVYYP